MNKSNKLLNVDKNVLAEISSAYETPCYVYSSNIITENFLAYKNAFAQAKHQICYAVKANSNLAVIKLLSDLGAGFDIVSIGELQRVIIAGGDVEKTIFSGVGKTISDIAFALEAGIEAFDVESLQELDTIIMVAEELDMVASISIRFNPDIDPKTHPYISTGLKDNKFGLMKSDALNAFKKAKESKWINIVGINMHIGSQLTDIGAYKEALAEQSKFVTELEGAGIELKHINVGGGLGVHYEDEKIISHQTWVDAITNVYGDKNITIVVEPGRSIVASAGVLLTEVLYTKYQEENKFVIVDAAMNDYMRVALYQAYNHIDNISIDINSTDKSELCNIVGPVCESGDFFAKKRNLVAKKGDLLAILDVGAYGFAMSSNYNSRDRAAEVMLEGDDFRLIRQRETIESQITAELIGEFAMEDE